MIPIGGFKDGDGTKRGYTLKSMKTKELEEQRLIEKEALDDTR